MTATEPSAAHALASVEAPIAYLLHLADDALILGQRNAEWCGHGPALEEDIAQANISLDLVGQARLLYQHAAQLINAAATDTDQRATEDSLAYWRDGKDFLNHTLVELPHRGPLAGPAAADRDYATTTVRNFLHSALTVLRWERLQQSRDAQLAAIAAKSFKEASYHLRHSRDWLLRMGDGTAQSHARAQAALDHLLPYTQEFWLPSPAEDQAQANGTGCQTAELQGAWLNLVNPAIDEATLKRPSGQGYVTQGKLGQHSEHLGFLLAEMQSLARAHPHAVW